MHRQHFGWVDYSSSWLLVSTLGAWGWGGPAVLSLQTCGWLPLPALQLSSSLQLTLPLGRPCWLWNSLHPVYIRMERCQSCRGHHLTHPTQMVPVSDQGLEPGSDKVFTLVRRQMGKITMVNVFFFFHESKYFQFKNLSIFLTWCPYWGRVWVYSVLWKNKSSDCILWLKKILFLMKFILNIYITYIIYIQNILKTIYCQFVRFKSLRTTDQLFHFIREKWGFEREGTHYRPPICKGRAGIRAGLLNYKSGFFLLHLCHPACFPPPRPC